MKSLFIYFLSIILILSCNEHDRNFNKILLNTKNSIWSYRIIEKDSFRFIGHHFIFNNDGTFNYFHSNLDIEKGLDIDYIHLDKEKVIRNWSYCESDSTFFIGDSNFTFKVLSFSKDSIYMIGKKIAGNFALIKIPLKVMQ